MNTTHQPLSIRRFSINRLPHTQHFYPSAERDFDHKVISSTILQIHINPFLIPSSIHFHSHLINSIQTSHQHSHSHKHSIHSYPISYPYTYHPLLYHTHFISNHTSPLITHHMTLSLHQSITHHPYYSYTNFPFLPIFTLNTFTLVPNAISTTRSFLQLSSKSTSIHSLYHPLFIFTLISSTLSKLHINILTHTNTLSTHIPSHIHIHTILCYTIHISSAITHHHSSRII